MDIEDMSPYRQVLAEFGGEAIAIASYSEMATE
jgi:hypothetical protein